MKHGAQDAVLKKRDGWCALWKNGTPTDRTISDYWYGYHHPNLENPEPNAEKSPKKLGKKI